MMDEEQAAMMQELSDIMQGFKTRLYDPDFLQPRSTSSASNININAGGVGLWIAVTCSIVTFVAVVIGAFFYVDQMRRVDRIQDYFNVQYQQQQTVKPTKETK
jgi:hypothetical protein